MAEQKVVAATSKALVWVVVAEAVIIAILFLSGFKTINPYLLLSVIAGTAFFIWYYFRKKKELDFYGMLDKIREKHYVATKYSLDAKDAQAIPITDDITYFYLPNEAKTFEVNKGVVKGVVARHLLKAVREKEKSRLFAESIKYSGAESRLKQSAEALNVDVESLGLRE